MQGERICFYNKSKSIPLLIAVIIAALSFFKVELSLFLILGMVFFVIVLERPSYCLVALIMLLPFSNTVYLGQNLAGIPGLKIANFILFLLLILFIVSRQKSSIDMKEVFIICGFLVLHGLSVIRSLGYFEMLELGLSPYEFLNSYLIKPFMYIVPMFIIISYMAKVEDVKLIVKAMLGSLALMSLFIVVLCLINVSSFASYDIIKNIIKSFFKLHTNDIADFYILGFPLILVAFLNRKSFLNMLSLILSVAAVAILFSRTAYVVIAFSSLLILGLNKKIKMLPVVVMIGFLIVYSLPYTSSVVDRVEYGIDESSDINKVFSGRINRSWMPVFEEIKEDPSIIILGRGFKSIKLSRYAELGHSHNMYIEALIDTGVFGLSFYVIFYFFLIKRIYGSIRIIEDAELKWIMQGVLVSILAYLMSGMMGRHFYPYISNVFLWVLLGIGLAILKIVELRCSHGKKENMFCSPKRLSFAPKKF